MKLIYNIHSPGVFNGPEIRKMFKSDKFVNAMTLVERRAFIGIKNVVENFLGNYKADNYRDIVKEMLDAFEDMNIHISLKIHFLLNHLDCFTENLGDTSDEHGEKFHQQLKKLEADFEGKNHEHMMGTYCWRLLRHDNPSYFKRKGSGSQQYFLSNPLVVPVGEGKPSTPQPSTSGAKKGTKRKSN